MAINQSNRGFPRNRKLKFTTILLSAILPQKKQILKKSAVLQIWLMIVLFTPIRLVLFCLLCIFTVTNCFDFWPSPSQAPAPASPDQTTNSKPSPPVDQEKGSAAPAPTAPEPSTVGDSSASETESATKNRQFWTIVYFLLVDLPTKPVYSALYRLGFDDTQISILIFFLAFLGTNLFASRIAWHFYGERVFRMYLTPSSPNKLTSDLSAEESSNTPESEDLLGKEE